MPEYNALLPGESGSAESVRNLGDTQTDGEWEKLYVKEARVSTGICATDGSSMVSPSELRAHLDNHPSGSTGGSTFAGLADTPADFSGAGGKIAAVKTDESGLEFIDSVSTNTAGTSDHGLLVGLEDDDHAQYYNQTRGDARYTKLGHTHGSSALDLSAKADLAHTHPLANITGAGTAAGKDVGGAGGVAELDENGIILTSQIPGSYDEIIEVASFASLPQTGAGSKIYVTVDTNKQYRWSGSQYAELSSSLALGATAQSAHRGDHGAAAYNHSNLCAGNPHNVTIAEIGAAVAGHNHDNDYANLSHQHDTLYLAKANSASFTPTAAYQPATKKYVDDNIGVGGAPNFATSGNLLINPDFAINQRGFSGSTVAAGEYCYDRWGAPAGGATISLTNGQMQLSAGRLRQICEYPLNAGDKLVFNCQMHAGSLGLQLHACDAEGTIIASTAQSYFSSSAPTVFTAPAAGATLAFDLIRLSGAYPRFSKLELRFGQTLPAVWQTPEPTLELQRCRRYYLELHNEDVNGTGYVYNGGAFATFRPPVPLRVKPAITVSGTVWNLVAGGVALASPKLPIINPATGVSKESLRFNIDISESPVTFPIYTILYAQGNAISGNTNIPPVYRADAELALI